MPYRNDLIGVLHAIGAHAVKVYSSSIGQGKNPNEFISKENHHNWTQNERYAWSVYEVSFLTSIRFAVDLGKDRSVCPTHYTLKYGSGGNLCCPRNWALQASNDPSVLGLSS